MKITMLICAAALAVCGTLSAQPATAVDHVTVRFSTPVLVGTTTMPAGDCAIQVVRGSSGSLFLAFRSEGVSASVLVNRLNSMDSETSATDDHARLVLNRRGEEYRFARLVMPDQSGFEILPNVE
jgi:hypothetical protein